MGGGCREVGGWADGWVVVAFEGRLKCVWGGEDGLGKR